MTLTTRINKSVIFLSVQFVILGEHDKLHAFSQERAKFSLRITFIPSSTYLSIDQ